MEKSGSLMQSRRDAGSILFKLDSFGGIPLIEGGCSRIEK
jgi:hypothetical protein